MSRVFWCVLGVCVVLISASSVVAEAQPSSEAFQILPESFHILP